MKKRLSLVMVFIYIFSCIIMPVSASSLDSAKKKQQQVNNSISQIKEEKKNLTNELQQNQDDKEYYDALVKQDQENLNSAQNSVSKVKSQIEKIKQEISEIDSDYEKKTELFKTRMRVMYQNMNESPLEVLIESKSFSEFLSRLQLLSIVKDNDEKLINEISVAKGQTEMKKQTKLLELGEKTVQLEMLDSKYKSSTSSRAKVQSDIEENTARFKQLEKKEDEMIALSEQISKEIAKLQDTHRKYAGGIMAWPTPGYTHVSSPYGYRIHPIYKVRKLHTGIDIDAPSGATIVAANSGKVIMAGWNGGYGNCVIIDHGAGIATLYGHQSKILVSVGQTVQKGDTIGKVGSTGLSTGPHLHFEVRINGETTNPMKYVS